MKKIVSFLLRMAVVFFCFGIVGKINWLLDYPY